MYIGLWTRNFSGREIIKLKLNVENLTQSLEFRQFIKQYHLMW